MVHCLRGDRCGALVIAGVLLFGLTATAAPKPKPHPKPETQVALPADLNDLSMRITALETLYEFDFTAEQLNALRTLASDTAQKDARTVAKGNAKLLQGFKDLHAALLKGDDDKIGELKDQLDELKDDDEVDLDDDVDPTDAARAKTPEFLKKVKASQIAAYLAVHAEELSDPAEQMIDSLNEQRSGDSDDPEGDAQDAADDIAHLVVGLDAAKGKEISDQVVAWFKGNRDLKEDEFAARKASLEESAKKIVGELPAMTVIGHWLDYEIATLLSNPQLPGAIDNTLFARAQRK
ncbi:MAG: hypothetical protein JWN40_5167 [Phycisphaerales bacterium]|nr:hypothetical protein [Phycisphaerales bacterium]